MQTLAVIWLVGGAACSLVYLFGVWPVFRDYARTSGVVFEVFHFGTRAVVVFALWPVVAILCIGLRGRVEPSETSDASHL